MASDEPPELGSDLEVRYRRLVNLRENCRRLAEGHLEALERFRTTGFPGRSLTVLPYSSVSLPTFRRDRSDFAGVGGLSRRATETFPPYDYRVSSTCAVVRSILRHPAASYRNLRPLHLLIELLARIDRITQDPTGGLTQASENILQLGQIADLAELIQQAVLATVDEESTDWPVGIHDDDLIDSSLAFQHAITECTNQVIRDAEAVAESRERRETESVGLETLSFSISRLERIAYLARLGHLRSDLASSPDGQSEDPNKELVEVLASASREALAESRRLLQPLREELVRNDSNTYGDPGGMSREATQIVRGIIALIGNLSGTPIEPNSVRGERLESALIAQVVMNRSRQRIRAVLDEYESYDRLRIDDALTPAHPYGLYWALAGLQTHDKAKDAETMANDPRLAKLLSEARSHYYHAIAKANVGDSTIDAIRIGYHAAIELQFHPTPDRDLARIALSLIVNAQNGNGTFPKADRMWLAQSGDAYGHALELLLTLLIAVDDDKEFLLLLEPCVEGIVRWLESTKQSVDQRTVGSLWGEDGSTPMPAQAWVTGEAYNFLYWVAAYCSREIADLAVIRFRGEPRRAGRPYPPSPDASLRSVLADFWGTDECPKVADILCANVIRPMSSRHRFFGNYLLATRADRRGLARSGILFGPPGTGKTTLAEGLAEAMGWPLISLGPYDFLRYGSEGVAKAAHEVFEWLYELEDCIILFDEMEEFMRSRVTPSFEQRKKLKHSVTAAALAELCVEPGSETREANSTNYVQRLWTTLFLPLLQGLHDEAKVIFLVATNHFDRVDSAISRPGRFDFRIHVLPPSPERKVREILIPELANQLRLSRVEQLNLGDRLTELLCSRTWLVQEGNQIQSTTHWKKEGVQYLDLEVVLSDGSIRIAKMRADVRFQFYTMANTRALARAVGSRVDPKRGEEDADLGKIVAATCASLPDIVPTCFYFDGERDHLKWSQLQGLSERDKQELGLAGSTQSPATT